MDWSRGVAAADTLSAPLSNCTLWRIRTSLVVTRTTWGQPVRAASALDIPGSRGQASCGSAMPSPSESLPGLFSAKMGPFTCAGGP